MYLKLILVLVALGPCQIQHLSKEAWYCESSDLMKYNVEERKTLVSLMWGRRKLGRGHWEGDILFLTLSLGFRLVTSLHIHSSNMKQSWKKLNETRFSFWYKMHFKHQDFSAVVELLQLTDQSCWAGRGVLFTTGLLPAEPQNFYKNLKQSFL